MEIQINGGSVAQKVDFAYNLFEKQVTVDAVFQVGWVAANWWAGNMGSRSPWMPCMRGRAQCSQAAGEELWGGWCS